MGFGHEKMDVYRAAIEYVGWACRYCESLKGHRNAKEQLLRASQAIPLDRIVAMLDETRATKLRRSRGPGAIHGRDRYRYRLRPPTPMRAENKQIANVCLKATLDSAPQADVIRIRTCLSFLQVSMYIRTGQRDGKPET